MKKQISFENLPIALLAEIMYNISIAQKMTDYPFSGIRNLSSKQRKAEIGYEVDGRPYS